MGIVIWLHIRRLQRNDPAYRARRYFFEAFTLIENGEYLEAFKLLSKFTKNESASKDVIFWLRARALNHLSRFKEALQDCEKSLSINIEFVQVYIERAKAQFGLGLLDEALNSVEYALRLNNKLAETYYLKAMILEKYGDTEAAECAYDKSAEIGRQLVTAAG
jgi:tetratricopeptide (TPR) repeat protein